MQAMEQDRNEPAPRGPRPLQGPPPEPDDVVRWMVSGIVAGVALLGFAVLAAVVVYVVQPAGWIQTIIGIVMVTLTVLFASFLASALRKSDAQARAERRR